MSSAESQTAWREAVAPFERPSLPRSLGQITNSILPYVGLWVAMVLSLRVSYWLTLALALPAAGFLMRSFIIVHDCGHGSFFRSRRANRWTGFWIALLTFLPAYRWSREHARHHAAAGDLDNRGSGDIWTLTVEEYAALPRGKRLAYRFYRNPIVLLVLGPIWVFLIQYRFVSPGEDLRIRRSTLYTNLALAGIVLTLILTIGLKAYLLVQVPVILFAGVMGVWLFYVQHQFEGVYWDRNPRWSYLRGALEGSSFYKLPRWLQWFSGNIGFHHVHHLSPRIPNYYLQKCHESAALFREIRPVTFGASFKTLGYRLWDEEHRRLVGFRRRLKRDSPIEGR